MAKRGRPAKARTCSIRSCTALAVTRLDVCAEHRDARNVRRANREERKARKARRAERSPSDTRRAIRERAARALDAAIYGPPGRAKFYVDELPTSTRKPRPEDDPRNWQVAMYLPGSDRGVYRERSTLPSMSPGIEHLAKRRGFTPADGSVPPARRAYGGPAGRGM